MAANDVAVLILAVVAVVTLVMTLLRDRRTDVAKTLERIEGDVKDLGGEVRKLAERVGAVETRLAVVETRVEDLRRPWPAETPAVTPGAEAPARPRAGAATTDA